MERKSHVKKKKKLPSNGLYCSLIYYLDLVLGRKCVGAVG